VGYVIDRVLISARQEISHRFLACCFLATATIPAALPNHCLHVGVGVDVVGKGFDGYRWRLRCLRLSQAASLATGSPTSSPVPACRRFGTFWPALERINEKSSVAASSVSSVFSDRAARCLEDLVADHERQGGLDTDDVYRLMSAHGLDPDEAGDVLAQLKARGLDPSETGKIDLDDVLRSADLRDALGYLFEQIRGIALLAPEDEVALGRRIALGQAAELSLEACPDNRDLMLQVVDGRSAREALVLANVRLVVSIARRHQGLGMDLVDVVQEGIFGLIRAAEKFDYTLGYKFSTYATWWIRQSITRGVADRGRLIRLPVHYVETVNRVRKQSFTLGRRLGRPPKLKELAEDLGMEPATVQAALDHARLPVSLDAELPGTEMTLAEAVAYEAPGVEEEVFAELEREAVAARLDALRAFLVAHRSGVSAAGAEILERRFGFTDGRLWTLEELGQEFGVSRERVRQVQEKILSSPKLRELFADLDPLLETIL